MIFSVVIQRVPFYEREKGWMVKSTSLKQQNLSVCNSFEVSISIL